MKGGVEALRAKINELNDEIRKLKDNNASLERENRELKAYASGQTLRGDEWRDRYLILKKQYSPDNNWGK